MNMNTTYKGDLRRELSTLCEVWRCHGASSVIIGNEDEVIYSLPENAEFSEPMLRVKMLRTGWHLCITGVQDNQDGQYMKRLQADALLIDHLISKETELETITDELVIYLDQQVALYDFAHALMGKLNVVDILETVADYTNKLFGPESQTYGAEGIFVIYRSSDHPEYYIAKGICQPDETTVISWLQELGNQSRLLIQHLDEPSIQNALLIAITLKEEAIGAIGLVNHHTGYTMPLIKLAQLIAEQSSGQIGQALFHQEVVAQARVNAQMELARQVQVNLLSYTAPQVPGLSIWATSQAASHVGGDFFHIFVDEEGQLRFIVGDVAGKGISAALLMAMTRTLMKAINGSSAKILERANYHLYDDFTQVGAFVTAFVGSYDPESHQIMFANAGHSPVMFCPSDGETTMLEADAPPIGVLPMGIAQDYTLKFKEGDVLVIATDGFPEAEDNQGNQFGYEAMALCVADNKHLDAQGIGSALMKMVSDHEAIASDDRTIVVLKREH